MKPRWTFAAVALVSVGCTESEGQTAQTQAHDPVCQLGDTRRCVGPGACEGGQVCLESGRGFGDGECGDGSDSGAARPDAGSELGDGDSELDAGPSGDAATGGSAGGANQGGAGSGGTAPGGAGGSGTAPGGAGASGGQSVASVCDRSPVADDATIAARLEALLGSQANVGERAEAEGWSLASAEQRGRLFDAVWAEPVSYETLVELELEHFQLARPMPELDATLAASFKEEARLVVSALTAAEAPLSAYYTTRDSYFDLAVAAAYGAPEPATAWEPSNLPEARQGVLLLGAWLAGHRGPSVRGNSLRAIRTCGSTPPHPANLDSQIVLEPTTRDAYVAEIEDDPVCAACHTMIDPMGFGFLGFDDAGSYRSEENGYPIDATGALFPGEEPFDGALELSDLLADESETAHCLATRLVERAGLVAPVPSNCLLQSLLAPLGSSSSFRDVLRAVVTSELLALAE